MNAIKFIQQHGIDKARKVVEGAPAICAYFEEYPLGVRYYRSDIGFNRTIKISDLKRLFESLDLVKSYGGIINAKHDVKYLDLDWDYDTQRVTRLKQAIADYESIYCVADMGDDSHIENHISPNCKVGVK